MYLRIDFKTGVNVGYAFVNFTHTEGVLSLLDNIVGRRWFGHGANKPAEVSYATVQGREALTNKFRNSSVMIEPEFCKPHIFWTWDDAMAQNAITLVGTQRDFPTPNNMAKLNRSQESKGQYGLYPPHASGAVVDHRNRSSQWDRGTPKDLEDTASSAHGVYGVYTSMIQHCMEKWFEHRNGASMEFAKIDPRLHRQFFIECPWMFAAIKPGLVGGPTEPAYIAYGQSLL